MVSHDGTDSTRIEWPNNAVRAHTPIFFFTFGFTGDSSGSSFCSAVMNPIANAISQKLVIYFGKILSGYGLEFTEKLPEADFMNGHVS